jgi:ribonuclease HI
MITGLYIASGLIGSNPSMIGGTYAWRLVFEHQDPYGAAAVLPMSAIGGPVTNNQVEMLALLAGLEQLSEAFCGVIHSQSTVTLGRAFQGWKWTNIPTWMHKAYQLQRARLVHWQRIDYELANDQNEHIQWCLQACREAGDAYMATIGANIPKYSDLPVEL